MPLLGDLCKCEMRAARCDYRCLPVGGREARLVLVRDRVDRLVADPVVEHGQRRLGLVEWNLQKHEKLWAHRVGLAMCPASAIFT
jgi:hypothetical protein